MYSVSSKKACALITWALISHALSIETGKEQVCNPVFPNLPPQIVIPISTCWMRKRRTSTELLEEVDLGGKKNVTWTEKTENDRVI